MMHSFTSEFYSVLAEESQAPGLLEICPVHLVQPCSSYGNAADQECGVLGTKKEDPEGTKNLVEALLLGEYTTTQGTELRVSNVRDDRQLEHSRFELPISRARASRSEACRNLAP